MREVIEFYKYASDKRFSTISGTLVYFLLMSVAPLLFWLSLLAVRTDFLTALPEAVKPVMAHLKEAAESASGGAGIIFLITSLYSSTNFFYHLRRSGEIIYGSQRREGGIRLRIFSLFCVLAVIFLTAFLAALPVIDAAVLNTFMPRPLAFAVSAPFAVAAALLTAYLLNTFACPYKLKFSQAINGSLLTVILWICGGVGFSVYLSFANPTRLYGAAAAFIIFLLWCYVMVNCLVLGMILNGKYYIRKKRALYGNKKRPSADGREVSL